MSSIPSSSTENMFVYVTHKNEIEKKKPFRKIMINSNDTIAELLVRIFQAYNIPFVHLKVYYNEIRLDKKKHALTLKQAIFDKNFKYGNLNDVNNMVTKASCLEIQSFFDLDAYLPNGKAYPYVGEQGEILQKADPTKLPTCWRRYIDVCKTSMSVRIIMWMWEKSYVTRLILIISMLFLIQSFFSFDRNFGFSNGSEL